MVGSPLGLRFQIEWPDHLTARSAADATRGKLLAWIGDRLVWGIASENGSVDALDWTWVELVEFLADAWPYLESEHGYPLDLHPSEPKNLRAAAEERWKSLTPDSRQQEEQELFAFEETHDLARGLQGAFPPSIWLVRDGAMIWVASETARQLRPADETLGTLGELGDAVAERLHLVQDARAKDVVNRWNNRRVPLSDAHGAGAAHLRLR